MSMLLGTATARIDLNNAGFMSKLQQSEQAMNRLGASGSKGMDAFDTGLGGTMGRAQAFGTVATGLGAVIAAPFLIGVKGAAQLEQSMANVNAALGGVDSSTLDALQDNIREIGVNSQYSAVEVAGVTESLAKAGFDTEEMMNGATQAVVDLSQATGDGLEPAFTGIVQAMSTWKPELVGATIGMDDASRAADILTIAANQSTAGLGDIIGGMRPLGPVAASMGISYEESAAAIALFTNNGLKGADAGISLARGLQNLADPTSEAADLMGELGIAAFDSQGSFVGFPSLFDQLQGSMGGMSDQAQLTALSTIFGAEAMDVMGLAILNGADPLEQMIALMGESGAASEQSALRMDTLGAQFDTLKEGVTSLLGAFVGGLIPGFRFVVDGANMLIDALMKIPAPVKTIIGALAGLTVAFAALTIGPQILGSMFGAIGIGSGVFAGFGAALGALIAPALAVAAVAGTIYLAWRTNFLGFRDLVQGVVGGVTGFFGDLKDTWDDVWSDLDGPSDFMKRLNKLNGVVGKAATYGNRFARVLGTIGGVMQRLSGFRGLGWLDTLGKGFTKAADFVEGFLDTWNQLGQASSDIARAFGLAGQALGGTANTVGRSFDIAGRALRAFGGGFRAIGLDGVASGFERLAGKVEGAGTVFRALREQGLNPLQAGFHTLMVTVPRFRQAIDTLAPAWHPAIAAFNAFRDGDYAAGFRQVGQSILGMGEVVRATAVNLGSIAVRIGGWAIEQAVDLGTAVYDWITGTAMPAIARTARDIGSFAVRIGGWLVEQAVDLGTEVAGWITGTALPAINRTARDIGAFAVRIADWTVTAAIDIGQRVLSWIQGTAIPTITRVAIGIGTFALKILDWTITAAIDVGLRVLAFIQDKKGTISRIATDIGTFAVRISDWLVSAGIDVGLRVLSFVQQAKGGMTRVATDIGQFAVKIADWTVSAAVDIGLRVLAFVQGAKGTVSRIATDIGAFAVKIADWTVTAAIDIGLRVLSFIQGAKGTLTRVATDIGRFAVKIADWTVTAAVDIGLRVLSFIQTAKGTITRVATDIGNMALKIADWTVSAAIDIGLRVLAFVNTAKGTITDVATDIGTIALSIADWTISSASDLAGKLLLWVQDQVKAVNWAAIGTTLKSELTGAFSTAFDLGGEIGSLLGAGIDLSVQISNWVSDQIESVEWDNVGKFFGELMAKGIVATFVGAGALVGLAGALLVGVLKSLADVEWGSVGTTFLRLLNAVFTAGGDFVTGLAVGLGSGLWHAIGAIEWANIAAKLKEGLLGAVKGLGTEAWDALWGEFEGGPNNGPTGGEGEVPAGQETRPYELPAGGKLNVQGAGGIGAVFNIPQIRQAQSGLEALKGSVTGLRAAMTALNGAGFGQGLSAAKVAASGLTGSLGTAKSAASGLGVGMQTIKSASIAPVTSQVAALKASMSSTVPIVGSLKAAIASISGGGGIGAAVGSGASGAAGAAMDAVGGGGGPFAALKTTITELSTTMTTFNSGPLTTLNAGFPMLGATIVGFNAGPLTTLNAAFPFLTASMTAFNAGPLTTLNAGFPLLGATIMAFNAGPLTTLNAAFPFLTASMLAFNAGPLTLLNAGFPILAATILAFNAGPLTTLNAAFPFLTASMLAFNAGPLTLLNAGFPLLGATILAFNAGPLTILNAAFPILTASIMAFNTMGLTVLNAGFPILGATILAFNAGPLTTLNAAFPILTATMTAFNAGPLTTLNAGFPILGATILAFNSGPLTTLNAAFPIVSASATALGATLDTVGGNVTTFGATVATMAANVSSGFAEMSGAASANMAALQGAVQGGMANASSAVRGEAAQWPGIISGLQGAMSGAGRAVGAAAGQGVAQGMRGQIGSIRSAANEIVSEVDRALRAAARIASPSKLTAEVGRMLTQGVAVGLESSASLRDVGISASRVIDTAFGSLTGAYTFGDKMFDRARGSLGGAIINGWERLTDGLYRDISGVVKKGILAEDNSYMVPREFGGIGGRVDESVGLERILDMTRRNREQRDALDRALGTRTIAEGRRRGQQVSAATRAGSRPNTGSGGGNTYITYVDSNNTEEVFVHNPTLEEQTWLDHQRMAQDGRSAAQTLRSARPSAQSRSGRRTPLRGV